MNKIDWKKLTSMTLPIVRELIRDVSLADVLDLLVGVDSSPSPEDDKDVDPPSPYIWSTNDQIIQVRLPTWVGPDDILGVGKKPTLGWLVGCSRGPEGTRASAELYQIAKQIETMGSDGRDPDPHVVSELLLNFVIGDNMALNEGRFLRAESALTGNAVVKVTRDFVRPAKEEEVQ